jgi:hypothetical protein
MELAMLDRDCQIRVRYETFPPRILTLKPTPQRTEGEDKDNGEFLQQRER